jgi:hypothetical protein
MSEYNPATNSDHTRAVGRGERACFYCTDPFWRDQAEAVVIERTVCDTDGSHIEATWFHKNCALRLVREIADSLMEGTTQVWSN